MGLLNRYLKPGKGVKKEAVPKNFGPKRFFSVFTDKFWRLSILNMLYFLVNFPLFFIFAYLAGVGGVPYQAPAGVLFQPLEGVALHGNTPMVQALRGVFGIQVPSAYPTAVTEALLWVGLLSLVTFGLATAAMTYIQRNFVKGQPVDLATDFFLCIKRNWKQSIALGLLDILMVFVILFDLVNYLYANQSFAMLLMLYATGAISLLYLMMRPYLYLMSVTFDIKITKMIRNALILAFKGLGRNVLCGVFAAAILILNVVVFGMIPSLGVGMFFIFTVSLAWFFQIYAAWPVVKKFMIDPYYEEASAPEEESVFRDQG